MLPPSTCERWRNAGCWVLEGQAVGRAQQRPWLDLICSNTLQGLILLNPCKPAALPEAQHAS
jgi:hypothetical protein